MTSLTVGVGDCKVSGDRDTALVTHALGSCIAVAMHDPVAGVGGLLHLMLPESRIDPAKAEARPAMFADTGITYLLSEMALKGALKRRLSLWVAGGAQVIDDGGVFNIGKRNYLAVRKILWQGGLLLRGEEVGGTVSRTVRLEVGSGRFWLRGPGQEDRELPARAGPEGGNLWRSGF